MDATNARVVSAAIGGVLMGVGVGYIVANKRLSAEFEERLKRETAEMREFYTVHRKKYPTPEAAVQELVIPNVAGEALVDYQGNNGKTAYHKVTPKDDVDPEEELAIQAEYGDNIIENVEVFEVTSVEHNIFESKPDQNNPYIIDQGTFMENEPEHEQSTLTYYAKDDTLTDEREELIDNVERVVGLDFKVNFGTGSSDERSVHVRNERLAMDFEIVKSDGAYAQEVLGVDEVPIETQRSRRQRGV